MKTTKRHSKYQTSEKTHVAIDVERVASILTSATGIPRFATIEA
jgi:hypothetical protein